MTDAIVQFASPIISGWERRWAASPTRRTWSQPKRRQRRRNEQQSRLGPGGEVEGRMTGCAPDPEARRIQALTIPAASAPTRSLPGAVFNRAFRWPQRFPGLKVTVSPSTWRPKTRVTGLTALCRRYLEGRLSGPLTERACRQVARSPGHTGRTAPRAILPGEPSPWLPGTGASAGFARSSRAGEPSNALANPRSSPATIRVVRRRLQGSRAVTARSCSAEVVTAVQPHRHR